GRVALGLKLRRLLEKSATIDSARRQKGNEAGWGRTKPDTSVGFGARVAGGEPVRAGTACAGRQRSTRGASRKQSCVRRAAELPDRGGVAGRHGADPSPETPHRQPGFFRLSNRDLSRSVRRVGAVDRRADLLRAGPQGIRASPDYQLRGPGDGKHAYRGGVPGAAARGSAIFPARNRDHRVSRGLRIVASTGDPQGFRGPALQLFGMARKREYGGHLQRVLSR